MQQQGQVLQAILSEGSHTLVPFQQLPPAPHQGQPPFGFVFLPQISLVCSRASYKWNTQYVLFGVRVLSLSMLLRVSQTDTTCISSSFIITVFPEWCSLGAPSSNNPWIVHYSSIDEHLVSFQCVVFFFNNYEYSCNEHTMHVFLWTYISFTMHK